MQANAIPDEPILATLQDPKDKDSEVESLRKRLEELESTLLGTRTPKSARSSHYNPKLLRTTALLELGRGPMHFGEDCANARSVKVPVMQPPVFDGELEEYCLAMGRWMRISGVADQEDSQKVDWILQSCSANYLPILQKVVQHNPSINLEQFLAEMERLFPKLENDLSIRDKLKAVPGLPRHPTHQDVEILILNIQTLFQRLS